MVRSGLSRRTRDGHKMFSAVIINRTLPVSEITAPLFEVRDEYELLALWRLVAEAKFQSDPDDADLSARSEEKSSARCPQCIMESMDSRRKGCVPSRLRCPV
jgi:hypothetical protein